MRSTIVIALPALSLELVACGSSAAGVASSTDETASGSPSSSLDPTPAPSIEPAPAAPAAASEDANAPQSPAADAGSAADAVVDASAGGDAGTGDSAAAPTDAGAGTATGSPPPDAGAGTVADAGATVPDAASGNAADAGSEDPGPRPTQPCTVTKDADGFFVRNSGKSTYVAYVPASNSPDKPMRLVVGLHGCGDDPRNFATWAVNNASTRATQEHIGISVGGETGGNKCWSIGGDDDKVLAAVDDISKCFWVDQTRVVVAGYSSGGQLAYRVGLMNASRFAGILIENSGLYAAGDTPAKLIAGATRKLPIAHWAHTGDSVFALTKVQADWSMLAAAGFPLETRATAGAHNGSGADWTDWLIPLSVGWNLP